MSTHSPPSCAAVTPPRRVRSLPDGFGFSRTVLNVVISYLSNKSHARSGRFRSRESNADSRFERPYESASTDLNRVSDFFCGPDQLRWLRIVIGGLRLRTPGAARAMSDES